jgi:hypothetical protein
MTPENQLNLALKRVEEVLADIGGNPEDTSLMLELVNNVKLASNWMIVEGALSVENVDDITRVSMQALQTVNDIDQG